jgi:hypothetical protein
MPAFDWESLLAVWNRDLLAAGDFVYVEPAARAARWLGFQGATEDQIASLERRLGRQLPASYREFLACTNGWRTTGTFIDRIWGVDDVDWFRSRNTEWIDAYRQAESATIADGQYFVYGQSQDPMDFRAEYLSSALEVSDVGDSAIYLLNPEIVQHGEWEAWFFANWLPGARRYRSFWEMMNEEYRTFLDLKSQERTTT